MTKKIFFLLLVFWLWPLSKVSKAETTVVAATTGKTVAKVGLFITSIYDFNLPENSFKTEFWMWITHKNPAFKPLETVEIPNCKEVSYSLQSTMEKDGFFWSQEKVKAVIKKNWQVWNYPFDRQYLDIYIEEAQYDSSLVEYVADTENSRMDKDISLTGWNVRGFFVRSSNHVYPTTYGDPTLKGNSFYPRVTVSCEIQRKGIPIFFKLFVGIYVAFFISAMAFFINPLNCDPRFGLPVGGLFAAIGNKYIADGLLPDANGITLIDIVHCLTFAYILFTIIISAYSLYLMEKNQVEKCQKLDRFAVAILGISYLVINFGLVLFAINI